MRRRLTVLLALMVILTGLLLSGDSKASTTNTGIPDNEIASSVNQTDSPLSANATITIIMTTPPLPEE
jgi:phosphate/sulfate permease